MCRDDPCVFFMNLFTNLDSIVALFMARQRSLSQERESQTPQHILLFQEFGLTLRTTQYVMYCTQTRDLSSICYDVVNVGRMQ